MFWLVFVAVIVLLAVLAALAIRAKNRKLAAAAPGSTRIESVKARAVNGTVQQYTRRGWSVVDQSSAKSLGSQARVAVTFRKR